MRPADCVYEVEVKGCSGTSGFVTSRMLFRKVPSMSIQGLGRIFFQLIYHSERVASGGPSWLLVDPLWFKASVCESGGILSLPTVKENASERGAGMLWEHHPQGSRSILGLLSAPKRGEQQWSDVVGQQSWWQSEESLACSCSGLLSSNLGWRKNFRLRTDFIPVTFQLHSSLWGKTSSSIRSQDQLSFSLIPVISLLLSEAHASYWTSCAFV